MLGGPRRRESGRHGASLRGAICEGTARLHACRRARPGFARRQHRSGQRSILDEHHARLECCDGVGPEHTGRSGETNPVYAVPFRMQGRPGVFVLIGRCLSYPSPCASTARQSSGKMYPCGATARLRTPATRRLCGSTKEHKSSVLDRASLRRRPSSRPFEPCDWAPGPSPATATAVGPFLF